jgi:hypothetical protein
MCSRSLQAASVRSLIKHPQTRQVRRRRGRRASRRRSLANLTRHTIAELTALVKTWLKRMQYRAGLLVGFLVSTGLESGPFL